MSRDAFHLLNGILYFFLPIFQVIFQGRKHQPLFHNRPLLLYTDGLLLALLPYTGLRHR